jgi:hypothetical protein
MGYAALTHPTFNTAHLLIAQRDPALRQIYDNEPYILLFVKAGTILLHLRMLALTRKSH